MHKMSHFGRQKKWHNLIREFFLFDFFSCFMYHKRLNFFCSQQAFFLFQQLWWWWRLHSGWMPAAFLGSTFKSCARRPWLLHFCFSSVMEKCKRRVSSIPIVFRYRKFGCISHSGSSLYLQTKRLVKEWTLKFFCSIVWYSLFCHFILRPTNFLAFRRQTTFLESFLFSKKRHILSKPGAQTMDSCIIMVLDQLLDL